MIVQRQNKMLDNQTINRLSGADILHVILSNENMTAATLSYKLGYSSPQLLYNISKGITKGISPALSNRIIELFPHYSRSWLLSGEGKMFVPSEDTTDEAPKNSQRASNEVKTNTSGSRIILRLPIIPIEAKAGIGKGFLYERDCSQDPDDIYDEFDSMEVFLEREVSDRYKLFRVRGDSMDDDTKRALCNGDVLLCREVYPEDWKYGLINTKFPNVIIVIEEEGILIKQLIKHSKKNETISLHSLNNAYKDLTIDLKKVRAFYYVERLIDRHLAQW